MAAPPCPPRQLTLPPVRFAEIADLTGVAARHRIVVGEQIRKTLKSCHATFGRNVPRPTSRTEVSERAAIAFRKLFSNRLGAQLYVKGLQ
jgi:hypothetical protein